MVDLNKEIDSFVLKFRHLWSCGLDAHLDLESNAGSAWIGLKLKLGEHPPEEFQKKRLSPSRIRRRERRATSFKLNEKIETLRQCKNDQFIIDENAVVHDIAKEGVINDNVCVTEKVAKEVSDTEEVLEEVFAERGISGTGNHRSRSSVGSFV